MLLVEPVVDNDNKWNLELALKQLKYNLSTDTINVDLNLLSEIKSRCDLALLPIVDPIDITFPKVVNITCKN